MIKTFTPIIAKTHGRILNLTIPSNPSSFFHPAGYSASKAPMNSMLKSFASEYKRKKIPVEIFGVVPGGISTDLNKHQSGIMMRTVEEGGGSIAKAMMDHQNHQGKIIFRLGVTQIARNLLSRRNK